MNRRDLFRQAFLGAAGAAASQAVSPAREFPPDYDASKDLARADWRPLFLDDHQNQTLIAFGDIVIPETDTPGAKTALVNRFVDQVLAVETHDTQRSFLDALAYVDGESFDRYRAPFAHLTPEQRTEIVTLMAYPHTYESWESHAPAADPGNAHFNTLKDWISRAYYSSPAGMRALGYTGAPGGVFEGCKQAGPATNAPARGAAGTVPRAPAAPADPASR